MLSPMNELTHMEDLREIERQSRQMGLIRQAERPGGPRLFSRMVTSLGKALVGWGAGMQTSPNSGNTRHVQAP